MDIERAAHQPKTRKAAHRALGARCRDHGEPIATRLGDEWAMRCIACGRFISVRDCLHIKLPPTKRQRQEASVAALIAKAKEMEDEKAAKKKAWRESRIKPS